MGTTLALLDGGDLALDPGSPEFREKVESGAVELARLFARSVASIREHWSAIQEHCERLDEVMMDPRATYHSRSFDLHLYYDGSRVHDYSEKPAVETVIKKMNVKVWEILVNRLGIKNLMSIKRREEFERQVREGDVPEVTEENILSVLFGLADRAADFAVEAAKETLSLLTPRRSNYKTNSGFKVCKRVILSGYVHRKWDGRSFEPSYYRDAELTSIDGTFHVLDGKGVIRGVRGPLHNAIVASPDGRGETEYFRFKCYKNHNLHVEFKRIDLVKKLNGLATGEYVLGEDTD